MNKEKPLILISNDDGFNAPGLNLLADVASGFGDVVVLAPAVQQSGKSSAVSSNTKVVLRHESSKPNVEVYSATGTPVDCVKLAFYSVCKDRKPDLILSGINQGVNSSINVIYSGTMGAVIEGCLNGIPSVGFSLAVKDFKSQPDYTPCRDYVSRVISGVLKNGLPKGVCLNVNFPKDKFGGEFVWCRGANAQWINEFTKVCDEPDGTESYLLGGEFVSLEPDSEDTDEWQLAHGHPTIVPIRADMTDFEFLKKK